MKTKSIKIEIMRLLAIYSVVCAHTASVEATSSKGLSWAGDLLNYIGTMGVPVFFCISGFLFFFDSCSFREFWKKKLKGIIIPWLFCFSILWIFQVIRKGKAAIIPYWKYVLGLGSAAYYLTVLMMMYLIFFFVRNNIVAVMAIAALSCVSIVSTGWNLKLTVINDVFGTYYTNPLNWALYFSLGIIVARKSKLLAACKSIAKPFLLWMLMSCMYFAICCIKDINIFYFSKYALLGSFVNLALSLGLAEYLETSKKVVMLEKLAKYSFPVYLLHLFIAGAVVKIMDGYIVYVLLRPLVVVFLTSLGCYLYERITVSRPSLRRLIGLK